MSSCHSEERPPGRDKEPVVRQIPITAHGTLPRDKPLWCRDLSPQGPIRHPHPGMTPKVATEAALFVVSYIVPGTVSYIVLMVVSHIVWRVVSDVTSRSPSSVVPQGILSGAGQVASRVMGRATRRATARTTPYLARQTTETAVPQII